jgi:para-nitrobenzyl esterase
MTGGTIEGIRGKEGINKFKGIPFAAPPVGPLRWKFPQPVVPWEGGPAGQAVRPFLGATPGRGDRGGSGGGPR